MGPIFVYSAFVFICVGALFRPSIGMVGYIGFVSTVPHWLWRFSLHDPLFPFQKYIAAATIIGFVFNGMRGTKLSVASVIAILLLAFYLTVSYVSAMQSIQPEQSWFFMNAISKIVLMSCIATKLLSTEKSMRSAVICIVLGVGWNAFEINADYFRNGFSLVNDEGWAYQNANGYALTLVLVTFLSLAMAVHSHTRFQRLAFLVPSILSVHAIYIIESRGGMLGLILGCLLFLVLMEKNAANVLLTSIAIVCAGVLAGPSVVEEFNSSFERNLDASADSRFYIWEAGVSITLDNPLLGVGPWAAEYLVPSYYNREGGTTQETLHLHNLPLEVSTGSGIPGLIAYCLFFFIPIRNALRINRQKLYEGKSSVFQPVFLGVFTGMAGYWFASLFNSGALIEMPYLFMALLIAVSGTLAEPDFFATDTKLEETTEATAFRVKHSR